MDSFFIFLFFFRGKKRERKDERKKGGIQAPMTPNHHHEHNPALTQFDYRLWVAATHTHTHTLSVKPSRRSHRRPGDLVFEVEDSDTLVD